MMRNILNQDSNVNSVAETTQNSDINTLKSQLTTNSLNLYDTNSRLLKFSNGNSQTTNTTYQFPNSMGSVNQVLSIASLPNSTTGQLNWSSVSNPTQTQLTNLGIGANYDANIPLKIYRASGTQSPYMILENYAGFGQGDDGTIQFRSQRYNTGSGGTSTTSYWELGINQNSSQVNDKFYIGRTGLRNTDFCLNQQGYIGLGTQPSTSFQLDMSSDGARKTVSSTWATGSDKRIKENIEPADLDICYDNIKNIILYRFKWIDKYSKNINDRNQLGFIADEVMNIYPKAVRHTVEKYLIEKGETQDEDIYEELEDFKTLDTDQILKCMFGGLQKTMLYVEKLQKDCTQLFNQNKELLNRIQSLESKLF